MIAIVLVNGKECLSLIAGEPFLFWQTQWLKSQGCSHIVFSARQYTKEVSVFAQQMSLLEPTLCLDVVTEPRLLGTAGSAAFCAKRFPSTPAFIIQGGSLLLTNVRYAISRLKKHLSPDGIIFGTSLNSAERFNHLQVDTRHHLISFKQMPPGEGLINAGLYILRPDLLNDISLERESSLESECFPRWLQQKRQIEVFHSQEPFIDIHTPQSLIRAPSLIKQHQALIMECEPDPV